MTEYDDEFYSEFVFDLFKVTDNYEDEFMASEMYELYKTFCKKKKTKALTQIAMTKALSTFAKESGALTFHPRRNSKGQSYFTGIRLK